MTHHASTVQATGVNPLRQGSGARGMSPYQAYECSDGWLVVAAPNDRLLSKLKGNIEEVRARGGKLIVFADSDTELSDQENLQVMNH